MICLRCKKDKNKDEFDFDPAVNRLSTYCRLCVWEQRNELKYFCVICGERKHYSKFHFHRNDEKGSGCDATCMKCTAKKKKSDREKKKRVKDKLKYGRCCNTCGYRQPLTEFKKNKKTKDGLHSTCNTCLEHKGTKNAR